MVRPKKFIKITGCLAITIALLLSFNMVTYAELLGWDLVDSTKHLDYNYSTKYSSSITSAVNLWNGHIAGVIRKSLSTTPDVYCSDYYEVSTTMAKTNMGGTIKFNDYHYATMTTNEKIKTTTHEFGHALGLAHTWGSTDVMQQGKLSLTSLSSTDKASYTEAYATY